MLTFIKEFYKKPEVSRLLAPRYAVKAGPTYLMLVMFKAAYKMWLEEGNVKVSKAFFYKNKPKVIRKLGSVGPSTCLCPKSANVGYVYYVVHNIVIC